MINIILAVIVIMFLISMAMRKSEKNTPLSEKQTVERLQLLERHNTELQAEVKRLMDCVVHHGNVEQNGKSLNELAQQYQSKGFELGYQAGLTQATQQHTNSVES